jgi:hypothetical protein
MCPPNPKYNIRRLLQAMPGKYMHNLYRLCLETGFSDSTIRTWVDIPIGSDFDIGYETMHKLADFFNTTPDQLLNRTELPATHGQKSE